MMSDLIRDYRYYDDCNMEYAQLFALTIDDMRHITTIVERAIDEFMQYTSCGRDDIEIVMGATVWNHFTHRASFDLSVSYQLTKPYEKAWFDSVEVTYGYKYCKEDSFIIRKKHRKKRSLITFYDNYMDRLNLIKGIIDKDKPEEELMLKKLQIKKVIYNEPATIVYWEDGNKTVVKAQKGELFDKEKGLAMAMCKRMNYDKGNYNDIFRKWCK